MLRQCRKTEGEEKKKREKKEKEKKERKRRKERETTRPDRPTGTQTKTNKNSDVSLQGQNLLGTEKGGHFSPPLSRNECLRCRVGAAIQQGPKQCI